MSGVFLYFCTDRRESAVIDQDRRAADAIMPQYMSTWIASLSSRKVEHNFSGRFCSLFFCTARSASDSCECFNPWHWLVLHKLFCRSGAAALQARDCSVVLRFFLHNDVAIVIPL
jgi:hypothetical protein